MNVDPRSGEHARLAALVIQALDKVATPDVRYAVLDRALMLAKVDSLPSEPDSLLDFVDGPLHEAVFAILGLDAAVLLLDQLSTLSSPSDPLRANPGQQQPVRRSAPKTLPNTRPTDDQSAASGYGSGAFVKPPEARRRRSAQASAFERKEEPPPSVAPRSEGLRSEGPRSEGLRSEGPGSEGPRSEGPRSEIPSVVVVDDEPNYRRALVRLLDSSGYAVNAAPNGGTALWMCERLQPDLVVTDYDLGDTNGLALAEEIKRRLGANAPPIILVTASATLPKQQPSVARVMGKCLDDSSLVVAAAEVLAAANN